MHFIDTSIDQHVPDDFVLHQAVVRNQPYWLFWYVYVRGIPVDQQDWDGDTALHLAAFKGNTNLVELLLSFDADINKLNKRRQTPLCYAIQGGHKEIVQMLCYAGALVNVTDYKNFTPLHYAIVAKRMSIILILLRYGAIVNESKDNDGLTLHDYAQGVGIDLNGILFLYYVSVGQIKKANQILKQNPQVVDFADEDGKTALILAAHNNRFDLVDMCLTGLARTDIVDGHGCTALTYAAQRRHAEVADLLLDAQASIPKAGLSKDTWVLGRYQALQEEDSQSLLKILKMRQQHKL